MVLDSSFPGGPLQGPLGVLSPRWRDAGAAPSPQAPGWLAVGFRLSAGFLDFGWIWLDSWSGLALAWFLDLASGFHLLGFWLDLA